MFGINLATLLSYIPYFRTCDTSTETETEAETEVYDLEPNCTGSAEGFAEEHNRNHEGEIPKIQEKESNENSKGTGRKSSSKTKVKQVVKYVPKKYTVYRLPDKEPRIYEYAQKSTRTRTFIPRHNV